jgi:prepilin-type N-terminal cleavage/methylation domain-containing protein
MISADSARVRSGSSSVPGLRSRPGFSLTELIITCILIGIISAISAGRITSMRAQQAVTRSAGLIQVQMEKAFALAGRNRAPMRIVWDPTAMSLSVTNRAQTVTYGLVKLRDDYGLKSGEVTVTQNAVEVYPNGFAHDTLSITISTVRGGTTYTKRVRMSRAGLVKVM